MLDEKIFGQWITITLNWYVTIMYAPMLYMILYSLFVVPYNIYKYIMERNLLRVVRCCMKNKLQMVNALLEWSRKVIT